MAPCDHVNVCMSEEGCGSRLQVEEEVLQLRREQSESTNKDNHNGRLSSFAPPQAVEKKKAKPKGLTCCKLHASPGPGTVTRKKEEHGGSLVHQHVSPDYLHKHVYESQRHYDDGKDGRAGNNNDHGRQRNKEGAQEHEHGGWQSLVDHIDVLGEAVDDASYRRGVKERLGRVKFVGEQVIVQLLGCADVPHG